MVCSKGHCAWTTLLQHTGCGQREKADSSLPFTLSKFYILIIGWQYCQIISSSIGKSMTNIEIQDLDWNLLWQQARKKKTSPSRESADWDKKAASFARRTTGSVYTKKFLALLNPRPEWSILDIGCGPGTLALPLATCCRQVTALDFSGNMLTILKKRVSQQNLKNISTHQVSWQDDWKQHGIKPHDVAIASRSLAVPNLKKALIRLSSYGTRKICITDRVKHGPFDPDAFTAIGRPLNTGPDYIYTVNLLYQMGYLPTVNYIHLEETLHYASFSEAIEGYTWMFRDLNAGEEKRLKKYVQSITTTLEDGTVSVQRLHVPTWAFISWQP